MDSGFAPLSREGTGPERICSGYRAYRSQSQASKIQGYFPPHCTAILYASFMAVEGVQWGNYHSQHCSHKKIVSEPLTKELWKSISVLGMILNPTCKGEEHQKSAHFFLCICIKSPQGTGIFVSFKGETRWPMME